MATRIEESMRGLMVWLGLAVDNFAPSSPASPPSMSLVPPPVPVSHAVPAPPALRLVPPPTMHLVPPPTECTRPPRRAGDFAPPPPRPPGPPVPPWAA
jgi:tellurite resistance protein TerA